MTKFGTELDFACIDQVFLHIKLKSFHRIFKKPDCTWTNLLLVIEIKIGSYLFLGKDDRKKKRKEKDHSENKSSRRPAKDGCGDCAGCLQIHDCGQ